MHGENFTSTGTGLIISYNPRLAQKESQAQKTNKDCLVCLYLGRRYGTNTHNSSGRPFKEFAVGGLSLTEILSILERENADPVI